MTSPYHILLLCAISSFATATFAAETIKIKRATYRADQSYACDGTAKVREICDGKETCTVSVDNLWCGDPKFGTPKKGIIEYSCGKKGKSQRGDENTDVSLSCE